MRASGQYHGLALLLARDGREREALCIWRELGSGHLTQQGHDGVLETIHYLRRPHPRLGAPALWCLVVDFSPWVIAARPAAALAIFMAPPFTGWRSGLRTTPTGNPSPGAHADEREQYEEYDSEEYDSEQYDTEQVARLLQTHNLALYASYLQAAAAHLQPILPPHHHTTCVSTDNAGSTDKAGTQRVSTEDTRPECLATRLVLLYLHLLAASSTLHAHTLEERGQALQSCEGNEEWRQYIDIVPLFLDPPDAHAAHCSTTPAGEAKVPSTRRLRQSLQAILRQGDALHH